MIFNMTVALTNHTFWLVDSLIQRGALTVLAAAPGSGATTLATGLIVSTITHDSLYLERASQTGLAAYLTSQGRYERTRTVDGIFQGHLNVDMTEGQEEVYFAAKDAGSWEIADIEEYLEACKARSSNSKYEGSSWVSGS